MRLLPLIWAWPLAISFTAAAAQPEFPAYTLIGAGTASPTTTARVQAGASNSASPQNSQSQFVDFGFVPPFPAVWLGASGAAAVQSLPPGGSANGAVRAESAANGSYTLEAARVVLHGDAAASARTDTTSGINTSASGSFDLDAGITFAADTQWTFSFVADSSPYKGDTIGTFGSWNLMFGRSVFGDLIGLPNVNIGARSGTLSGFSAAGTSLFISIGGGPSAIGAASFRPLAYEWGQITAELSFTSALTPPVPEPAMYLLWASGLAMIAGVKLRRRLRR